MSFDDWLLALHLLSAFAYAAALVVFWALVVAFRTTDTPEETVRLGPTFTVGNVAVGIGATGTIVLGVWLALSVGGYDIWDGWIIAAIVLWAISAGLGDRAGKVYMRGLTRARELRAAGQTGPSQELLALNRTSAGATLHALSTLVFVLIVVDMIWKPGA